ncbi:MAG: hypothetical protein LBI79_07105 [Nitrososphaerota archaeon]|nr:hypothetical protein [Nitrososphaerota archaeon]
MALYAQKNKVWVWKAYCRTTGELVDWECGNRSAQTLKKMLDRLQQLNVGVSFADNWGMCGVDFRLSCGFKLRRRCIGWSGIIFGSGLGVVGFVGKPVWFREVYV